MTKPSKPPKEFVVSVAPKKRVRNPSKTCFSKENPSPNAFVAGQSANPGGHAQQHKLISKALRTYLSDRCPDEICKQVGLPSHASWGQVVARRILMLAVKGDIDYMKLLLSYHEGLPKEHIQFEDVPTEQIHVHFVESEYCKQHPEDRGKMTITPPTQMPPPPLERSLQAPESGDPDGPLVEAQPQPKAPAPPEPAPRPRPVHYDDPRKDPSNKVWYRR